MSKRRFVVFLFALVLLLTAIQTGAFAEEGTIKCQRCGKDVPDYSNYCLYCGNSLRPESNTESVLESETGRAAIVGLAPVPDDFLGSSSSYTPADLILVLVQYTNFAEEDRQFQNEFWIEAYQNGVELSHQFGSYHSGTCREYDNFSKTILQNGTVTVGRIFVLDDNSDVTVRVRFNGSSNKDKAKGTFSLGDYSAVEATGSSGAPAPAVKALTKEEKLAADIELAKSVLQDVHLSSNIEYSTLRVYIDFVNPNEKTIKYIDWGIMFINTVGDFMSKPARYSDPNIFICQDTGPYATNEGRYGTDFRWTFYGHEFTQSIWDIAELRLGSVEIEYMDGTKVKIDNPDALDTILK